MKTPYFAYCHSFKFCWPSPFHPQFFVTSNPVPTPPPTAPCVVFLWLNRLYLMILWIYLHRSRFGTLAPELPCCVFYATSPQVYTRWSDTRWFLLVLWFDITHPQAHTARLAASKLTHPYRYIFTPPVMCSQQVPLIH